MRRAVIILLGIALILGGSLIMFKEAYGESISGTSESIAVNYVAMKINASLRRGIYRCPGHLDF